jgi:hypothetical protein
MAGSQNRSIQVHHEPMAVASRLPCDRSQRADIRPAVEDVRAMPAIILPAGAREAFQKSDPVGPFGLLRGIFLAVAFAS